MPDPYGSPLGGLGAGVQAFMQGQTFRQDQQKNQQDIEANAQKLAGPRMLMLQQEINADPSKLKDANFMAEYNKSGAAWGLPPADPQTGIPASFGKMDLMQIINPDVYQRTMAAKEEKAATIIANLPKMPGDPIANAQTARAALQMQGLDTSQLDQLMTNPQWVDSVQSYYGDQLSKIGADIAYKTSDAAKWDADTKRTLTLLPAWQANLNARTNLANAGVANIGSEISNRAGDLQVKRGQLQNDIQKTTNAYTLGVANLNKGWATLSETQRRDGITAIQKQIDSAAADARQLIASAQASGDPDAYAAAVKLLHNDQGNGVADQIGAMNAQLQGMMDQAGVNPAPQGKPAGTKVVPRGTPKAGAGVPYDPGTPQMIHGGTYDGFVTYKGGLGRIVNGKLVKVQGTFSPSPGTTFSAPPAQ